MDDHRYVRVPLAGGQAASSVGAQDASSAGSQAAPLAGGQAASSAGVPRTATLVIGVGNVYRSDDAVGLAAAQLLRSGGLPHIRVVEAPGDDGTVLMETWQGAERVILIDAVSSGEPPGTIYRFDVHTRPIPADFLLHSTHAFGVAEALELARALDQLPPYVVVFAIEGQNFAAGVGLSAEVEGAMHEVVERVVHETMVATNSREEENPRSNQANCAGRSWSM